MSHTWAAIIAMSLLFCAPDQKGHDDLLLFCASQVQIHRVAHSYNILSFQDAVHYSSFLEERAPAQSTLHNNETKYTYNIQIGSRMKQQKG